MEQNYFEKVVSSFSQSLINKFSNNSNLTKSDILKSDKNIDLFHTDCKFSKKKICHCNQFKSSISKKDLELAMFLDHLVNDKIDICCNTYNKKIEFKKKEDLPLIKKQIEAERINNLNYFEMRNYLKNYDENVLSLNEYKEIEKNINEDKKICENCKTNIYENNFHKGWKNELGEYVLLCPVCSRKYFNGALEIKFENKRLDESIQSMKSINLPKSINNIEMIEPPTSIFNSFLLKNI